MPKVRKVEDWRGLKCNTDMSKYMLDHGIFTDCTFRVGLAEDEENQVFHCHKTILARNSPVFGAMFYGTLAEQVEEIRVSDIKPEIFKLMLTYIYTEQLKLNCTDEARDVAYAADKYMVTLLKNKSIKFWCKNIDVSNVLKVMLTDVPLLRNEELDQTCLKVIQQYTRFVINQSDFKLLPVSMLEQILRQKTLSCDEYDLVMSAERWAEHQVRLRDLPEDSLRDCLEPLIPLMRFRAMSMLEFECGPGQSNWLTQAEKLFILRPETERVETINVTTSPRSACVFSSDVATEQNNFKEFRVDVDYSMPIFELKLQTESDDFIDDITIKGVRMYTQIRAAHLHFKNQQNKYVECITITLREDPKYRAGANVAHGCMDSVVNFNSMMDVMFKTPLKLKQNYNYILKIKCNNGGAYPVWSTAFSSASPRLAISTNCTPVKSLILA